MTGQDWLEKDFYKTLGVPKDADEKEVRKAYRKLARQYHPDQNAGNAAAEEKFKEIGEAFAVLSDPEQRSQYDSLRAMAGGGARFSPGGSGGFDDMFSGMFGGASPGAGGGRRFDSGGCNFEDILGSMFGAGGRQSYGAQRGGDITASARLPFRAAVEGSTVGLTLSDGRNLSVKIPAGVHDGQKIRLPGKGQPGVGGGPAGDLVVTVQVESHPVFGLTGRDLTITVPVTFPEAAEGAVIEVPTFDGAIVKMKVPAGTQSGTRLKVSGRGAQTKKGTGDLLVTVEVAVPRKLTGAARDALNAYTAATEGENPRAHLRAEAAR